MSDLARPDYGLIVGFEANGYLGQYLIIYPAYGIVAVRMIRPSDRFNPETDSFDSFRDLVRALIP